MFLNLQKKISLRLKNRYFILIDVLRSIPKSDFYHRQLQQSLFSFFALRK